MSLGALPIQAVAQRTGLSVHVIRIWEKRYGAVKPLRTATNRRLYTHAETERLTLLRQLTERGHNIGFIAKLDTSALRGLLAESAVSQDSAAGVRPPPESPEAFLNEALDATRHMNPAALQSALERAERHLGGQGLLQKVVAPLSHRLGERWRSGDLTAAHEHFATAALKLYLGQLSRPYGLGADAPLLVIGTPAGQLHELGALLVSACAANLGWRVLYLGPSLGAPELAGAVLQNGAQALALSIVYPEDDPALPEELRRLRSHLPDTPLIVGGRAAAAYGSALRSIAAHVAQDLAQLGNLLDAARRKSPAAPVETKGS